MDKVGTKTFGFGAHAHQLQVVEGPEHGVDLGRVELLLGFVEAVELPGIGRLFACQRVDFPFHKSARDFVDRWNGQCTISLEIVAIELEQVGLDPVGEFGRQVERQLGDVRGRFPPACGRSKTRAGL